MTRADRVVSALTLLRATDPTRAKALLYALQDLGDGLTLRELVDIVDRLREVDRRRPAT